MPTSINERHQKNDASAWKIVAVFVVPAVRDNCIYVRGAEVAGSNSATATIFLTLSIYRRDSYRDKFVSLTAWLPRGARFTRPIQFPAMPRQHDFCIAD